MFPQTATVPLLRKARLKYPPAAMVCASARDGGTLVWKLSFCPQAATVPSVRNARWKEIPDDTCRVGPRFVSHCHELELLHVTTADARAREAGALVTQYQWDVDGDGVFDSSSGSACC